MGIYCDYIPLLVTEVEMKRKTITLLSGNEEDEHWTIALHINRKGIIYNTGYIACYATKRYYIENCDNMKARSIEWNRSNKERKAKTRRKWYKENKVKAMAQAIKWNNTNIVRRRAIVSKYTKANWRKGKARRRELGFIPLNDYFEGACAHHVDRAHIVYIPDKIHRGHSHNLKTGRGMAKINGIAFKMLFSHNENEE